MNKKWLIVMIALFVVVVIMGGKVYMDKKEEVEKIEAERMSVKALKLIFADIKSVEIEQSTYNKMTSTNGKFVKFIFLFATNHPNEIGAWGG